MCHLQKQTKNALTKRSLHGVLIDEMIHVKNLSCTVLGKQMAFQPFFSNLGIHLNSLQLLPPRFVILLLKNQAEKLQHFRVQDHNIVTMLHELLHQAFTGVILCTPPKRQHPGQV